MKTSELKENYTYKCEAFENILIEKKLQNESDAEMYRILYSGAQIARRQILQKNSPKFIASENASIMFLALHSIPEFSAYSGNYKLNEKLSFKFVTEVMSDCLELDNEARPHPFNSIF